MLYFFGGGGDSPASEFYVPTFFGTLCQFHLHRRRKREFLFTPPMKMEQTVFRNVGIENSDVEEPSNRKNTTTCLNRVLRECMLNLCNSKVTFSCHSPIFFRSLRPSLSLAFFTSYLVFFSLYLVVSMHF